MFYTAVWCSIQSKANDLNWSKVRTENKTRAKARARDTQTTCAGAADTMWSVKFNLGVVKMHYECVVWLREVRLVVGGYTACE